MSIASAGTRAVVGAPMQPESAAQLKCRGTPDGFVARQVTPALVEGNDLILCATRDHRSTVVRLAPRALNKTFALTDFADLVSQVPPRPLAPGPLDGPETSALTLLVRAAARERGSVQPRTDDAAAITDPIGRPEEVFAQMAHEIEAVLPPVVEALKRHVGGRPD